MAPNRSPRRSLDASPRVGARWGRKAAHLAYVGLGSNVGDRAAMLNRAIEALRTTPGVSPVRVSPSYETAAVGYTNQPDFLNAVVEIATALGPIQLFLRLKQIEVQLGRTPTFHWGPREIDLDLLLFDDVKLDRRGLIVPHPAMFERPFVMVPLGDLRPDLSPTTSRRSPGV